MYRIDQRDLPSRQTQPGRQQQTLPAEAGAGKTEIIELDQGLSLIDTRYRPNRDLAILSRIEQPEARLVLTLGLQGHSAYQGQQGESYCFAAGCATATRFSSSAGERLYRAEQSVRQLRCSIGQSWLERYCGRQRAAALFAAPEPQLLSHGRLSAQSLHHAGQLAAMLATAEWRLMPVHGMVLNLLALELERLCDSGPPADNLSQRDKRMAEKAREILYAEYQNPPSVAELAARVGTNTFKLKQLFHRYFQTTPYQMLAERRMRQACRLLAEEQLQVAQVAERVGYRHAGNFSAAFSRHFGYPPKAASSRD